MTLLATFKHISSKNADYGAAEAYPGLGTLAYESARYKDYNLLMLLSLLSGALVILCSIIAQTINEQIDPRIRAEQAVREAEVQP